MTAQAGPDRRTPRWALPHFVAGALAARIADEGARVTLVLLALEGTGSAGLGGAMVATLLVPHVVAAPLVGVLVDRSPRPRLVLAAAVSVFAASLCSVALLLGRSPLWVIFVLLLLGGCCGPAITGGLSSQLPGLVGTDRTPRAFGVDSLFYNVASMVGPGLAGVVATAASPATAQIVLAASAAIGAAGIASLPIAARPRPDSSQRPGLLAGAREILRQPTLRIVTLASTLGQVGPGALTVVAAVLATSLHSPSSSGLLLTAVAAGSFLGSLLWTWHPLAPHRSPLVTAVAMIGIAAPIAVAAVVPSIEATTILFGVSGVFVGPFGSALFTARTTYAAERVRTQVFTIGAGLKVSASALGAALIGFATHLPVPTQLLLVASTPLLAGVAGTVLLLSTSPRASSRPARLLD